MEPNSMPPVGAPVSQEAAHNEKTIRFRIAMFGFFLFIVFVVGLFWMITTPELTVGLTLSFVAGLSMIFLPCTLPLAFVIVPLTMGKEPKKGLLMALCFTLGLTITLSFYGVFIAAVGKTFGLKSDAEVYAVLLGGFAAFIFGLSEVGLIKFKLPSYAGNFPDFIQRKKDYMKTFLLGLLLGNAGVGCPNPAFYILLGYIATTGDLFNGWFLGFVHGMGRSVPLIFLAILGTLGVNALSGLARHKEAITKVMGWMLLIIGAYLLTFGIFGHDWFIASGIHSSWEQFVVDISGERFGETILKHEHKLIDVPNFIQYGNMFFLGLLALTILVAFVFKRPSRKTILWLSVTYILIALVIGYSTDWNFRVGRGVHVQFHGMAPASSGAGGGHIDDHVALYHEENDVHEGIAVNLNVSRIPVMMSTSTTLKFFVNEKPHSTPIGFNQLEEDHTKLMHVIGIRDDMNEFFHIHPSISYEWGILSTGYIFQKPGRYKIWSEIKKDGAVHVFGHPEIDVQGFGLRSERQVSFGRSVIVDNYQVALKAGTVQKGIETDLSFDIHDAVGNEVEVEPYLAADMHLTIIKDDLTQLIHTHPEDHGMTGDQHAILSIINKAKAHGGGTEGEHMEGSDERINFHATFPEIGLYRIFAQFRPKGINLPADEALTASFWIEVKESGSSVSQNQVWWMLGASSLALMAVLSFGIYKFLQQKI